MVRTNSKKDLKYEEEFRYYFPENNSKFENINFRNAIDYLRKILIYLITLFKFMNDFINFKISSPDTHDRDSIIFKLIKKCENNILETFKNKIIIDEKLLSLPLNQLIDLINIDDITIYMLITHKFLYKRDKKNTIKTIYKGKIIEFGLNYKEKCQLLCCKTKRKDELIKFGFKFIRRKLISEFKNKMSKDLETQSVKKKFNERFLNNNKEAIIYFESFEVSKKDLAMLNDLKELKQMMSTFQRNNFISSIIKEYILIKQNNILKGTIAFTDFVDEIFSRQHKHSMVVQRILNSLEHFAEFFHD